MVVVEAMLLRLLPLEVRLSPKRKRKRRKKKRFVLWHSLCFYDLFRFLGGIRRRHGIRIIRLSVAARYVICPEFMTTLFFFDSITALNK